MYNMQRTVNPMSGVPYEPKAIRLLTPVVQRVAEGA